MDGILEQLQFLRPGWTDLFEILVVAFLLYRILLVLQRTRAMQIMLGVAVITKQEILLVLVGGLFVAETLSVIFQVGFFKITGGKRIFRMAPLHHHFELKGWPEPKVIVRFWIVAIALALLSMSTLKLR